MSNLGEETCPSRTLNFNKLNCDMRLFLHLELSQKFQDFFLPCFCRLEVSLKNKGSKNQIFNDKWHIPKVEHC